MEQQSGRQSYAHILKYASLFGGIEALSIMISVVRSKLVAMLLGPGGMGIMSLYQSQMKLAGNATGFGLPVSGVRQVSEASEKGPAGATDDAICQVRSWGLVTALLALVATVACAPWLNEVAFDDDDHVSGIAMLAPAVALATLTACETTVLKATRQLGGLARRTVANVFLSLVVTVPMFYFFREKAIVPALIVISVTQLLLTASLSLRLHPYRVRLSWRYLRQGVPMMRLGTAFVVAGIVTSGAEFGVRALFNQWGSMNDVGLYNAGYVLSMTYGGLVFTSIDTDYFPRLSAVNADVEGRQVVVDRQMEVSLLFVAPMMMALMVMLPVVVPLLYTPRFLPVVGMAQAAVVAMVVRAVYLPMAYLHLACGRSRVFMLMECGYGLLLLPVTAACFALWGLFGAGIALAIMGIAEALATLLVVGRCYGFRPSRQVAVYFAVLFSLTLVLFAAVQTLSGWAYWLVGLLITALGAAYSLRELRQKTHLWERLTAKLRRRR